MLNTNLLNGHSFHFAFLPTETKLESDLKILKQ